MRCNHLISNMNQKCQEEPQEYMLRMSAVKLIELLNALCKDVDEICIFLLGDHLNLLSDGCIQYSDDAKIAWVGIFHYCY